MKTTKFLSTLLLALLFINCADTKKDTNTTVDEESTEVVTEDAVKEEPLFARLGGIEGISAIVDDVVDAHLNNPAIKDRFIPLTKNPEYFESFKQHVKDFFGAGTGGDVTYTGRDMANAHKGLGLSGMEFVDAISDILIVLEKHEIDVESKKDVLYILYSFKDQVIGQ